MDPRNGHRACTGANCSQEDELTRKDLTLDEFEGELGSPERKRVTVRFHVQTSAARQDFDWWLADMRTRHPWKPAAQLRGAAGSVAQQADIERVSESEQMRDVTEEAYWVKEAVGVPRISCQSRFAEKIK